MNYNYHIGETVYFYETQTNTVYKGTIINLLEKTQQLKLTQLIMLDDHGIPLYAVPGIINVSITNVSQSLISLKKTSKKQFLSYYQKSRINSTWYMNQYQINLTHEIKKLLKTMYNQLFHSFFTVKYVTHTLKITTNL